MSFSKNIITVEIDIDTQFGPIDAVDLIKTCLQFPAITRIEVQGVKSNFQRCQEPSDHLYDFEIDDLK